MSADNGMIIRNNDEGKFVVQMFFMSDDCYPSIDEPNAQVFDTLEEAVAAADSEYTEYGMTFDLNNQKTNYTERGNMTIQPSKFARKPFYVDAVQVSPDNFADVAEWCKGEVILGVDNSPVFIKVKVNRPMSERQTKAFVGDWVLYAGTGYKVYTDKAFRKSFDEVNGENVGEHLNYRDASTGEYVTEEFAHAHPETTVSENS